MMYAFLTTLAVTVAPAAHAPSSVLNGTWRGRMNLQIAGSTCPASECTLPRDSVFVFDQGQLAYGEDSQILEERENNLFCLVAHNDQQMPGGRVVSFFYGYGFTVLPTGNMAASVVTKYLVSQENVGVVKHGCTCSYMGIFNKDPMH